MTLIDIEKNDVDISQLFAYKDSITLRIPGTEDEITFYQRVIGDADNNKARVYGLRESGQFRSDLNNKQWENRVAYVPDISKLLKADLIEISLTLLIQDLSLQAINEVSLKEPAIPKGDAGLEEQEKYQEAIDEFRVEFSSLVAEKLEKKIRQKREELNKFNKEELKRNYEQSLIDQQCKERFGKSYLEMATYYGTYTDKEYKTRAFKSFEAFLETPTNLKEALISSYGKLQIDGVALKKLQGVTP